VGGLVETGENLPHECRPRPTRGLDSAPQGARCSRVAGAWDDGYRPSRRRPCGWCGAGGGVASARRRPSANAGNRLASGRAHAARKKVVVPAPVICQISSTPGSCHPRHEARHLDNPADEPSPGRGSRSSGAGRVFRSRCPVWAAELHSGRSTTRGFVSMHLAQQCPANEADADDGAFSIMARADQAVRHFPSSPRGP
jgi:hypothetical protein